MAMPVVPYTDVTGAGRPRSVTGGTPVRATVRPPAADRRVHCRVLPGCRRFAAGRSTIRRRGVVGPSSSCRRSVAGPSSGCQRGLVGVSDRSVPTSAPPGGPGGDTARTRPAAPRPEPAAQPAPPHALRSASGHPQRHRSPPPDRPRGRMEAAAPLGRAPVERMISAHATVCFQPTSFPSQSLAEMADQPPCQQAEGDRAVRFHPTGTGHERQAHFPARLTSETLRDRMLPARLPCRHKAGW